MIPSTFFYIANASASRHEQEVHALGHFFRSARAGDDVREHRGVLIARQRRVAAAAPVALLDARLCRLLLV